jgi:PAS domain S-box-containing protein
LDDRIADTLVSAEALRAAIRGNRHQSVIDLSRIVTHSRAIVLVTQGPAMESELSRVVDALPGFVWTALPDGQVDFLNQRWCGYTGLGLDQSCGRGWQTAIHPDDLSRLLAGWQGASVSAPVEAEARVRGSGGNYRWFLFRAHPTGVASGQVVKWCGLSTDIEHRWQADDALRALLEMVANGRAMPDILETLCRLVESTASGCICSIVLVDPDGTKLQEAIAPSLATEFNDAVRGWPLNRIGGPCVMAARDKVQVIMSDVASDTRWRNGWRALAQAHGLRSCWSTPIVSLAGKVLGTFALYQREPGSPSPLQLELIAQFTNVASITIERTQRDAALRLSEARLATAERDLQLMIDTIPVFVAAYELDGTRSFVNRTWQEYMSLSLQQATGEDSRIFPHFHPDDAERNDKAWRTALATGDPLSIEVRVRRADGQYRWHTSQRVPLRDEKGAIVRWYSVGIDIEDRKCAEDALRRSETLLAEGQRLSLTGTFSWRVDTNAITFSQELHRIFEFDPNAVVTLGRLRERTHPEDRALMDEKVSDVRTGRAISEIDVRLRMPDGRIKYLRIIGRLIRCQDGQLEFLGAIQDVTQGRIAEETLDKVRSELAHVTRIMSLGTLMASIAHEVNQPLAGIITNANTCLRMLAADPPNLDGARETARRTIRDGNRAADVITRLRALFSRKGTATETVDLSEAAREVLALVSSDLLRSRVILRAELGNEPLLVPGDRVQLQQVIVNLVRNALDAMSGVDDRPRQLLVRTDMEEDRARLVVKDTGVGLEPQGADRLFDVFYTTKSNGMGIGLSVSRSIIESHGGKLWAEPNDGPGATFSFSLPRQARSSGDEGTRAISMYPTRGDAALSAR